jgi:membrane-bound serine protease (ClpP class)
MFARAVLVVTLVLLALPAAAQGNEPPEGPHVVLCPIEGMIDEGIKVLVKRAVAEAGDAQAIVFTIDTFGGRVDSAFEIANSIMNAPCPTIAYIVGKGAISAGALISYACDHIVMGPGTSIGAAQPVMAGPEGMQPTGEKEVSVVRSRIRALAEENGHNPDIAEAMVDKTVVLRVRTVDGKTEVYGSRSEAAASDSSMQGAVEQLVRTLGGEQGDTPPDTAAPAVDEKGGTVIDRADQLLTLTSQEALQYGVIPRVARSLDEVLEHFGYGDAAIHEIQMTMGERAFRFLTDPIVAGLLLMLGIGGIYIEIKTPGFGAPGIIGATCLALFFGSHFVIGLVDWIDILLVVVGLGLILAEIFVIPGFGVAGISGLVCILVGLYLSLTRVPFPQHSWDFSRLQDALTTIGIGFGGMTLLALLLMRILPQTPIYRKIVLADAQVADLGYAVQTTRDRLDAVGLRGVAATVLRPAGRGRFNGKIYDVVSHAEYIEEGTPIVIVEVEGNRYVVEKADTAA